MLGDFNAQSGESFCDDLLEFRSEHELLCEDLNSLGILSGLFTFINEVYGCSRWLDQCIATHSAGQAIMDIWVCARVHVSF